MYNASAWCKADDSKFVRRTRWHSTIALSRSLTMLRIDWPFISIYNLMELSSTEINRSVLCCVLAVWKKSCWRLSKLTWNQNNRKFGENCLVSKDNVQVRCWFSGAYFSCRLGQSSPRWVTIFFCTMEDPWDWLILTLSRQQKKHWLHPRNLTWIPKKGTISLGNTFSNHWFSGDMLVFREVVLNILPRT